MQNMTIHTRIRLRRQFLGLSMEQLAALVDVKAWQTVQQWEKEGGTAPKRGRLDGAASALKTTASWLVFGADPTWKPELEFVEFCVKQKNLAGSALSSVEAYNPPTTGPLPIPLSYPADTSKFRRIYLVGRANGGLPERIWTDGDYPVGAADKYAELASPDPHAFLTAVVGTSMVPRFNPGEFALVEPGTEPELEDDVLVRLASGETMIKRLISRRGGIQLASYNEPGTLLYQPDEITWLYYIAHPVPARKIKTRI